MLHAVNFWAVILAAISVFILGGIWYSPLLFGNCWKKEANVDVSQIKHGHSALVFTLSFILSLVAALAFAVAIGPTPSLLFAVGAGFITGICWVATSFGINYAFANRGIKLFLIDAGYHVAQFTLYGVILGLWH